MVMIGQPKEKETAMSFVSFKQSLDLVNETLADSGSGGENNFEYLNTMVRPSQKVLVAKLAERYGISQGFVLRTIIEQWCEMLRDCE